MNTKTKGDILAERIEKLIRNYLPEGSRSEVDFLEVVQEYRKPWTLGRSINGFTLADGQEWHRNDWTEDMLPEGWRPMTKGELMLKFQHEYSSNGKNWVVQASDVVCQPCHDSDFIRTRRPLPTVAKLVPLGPEDVPPGSVIRSTKSVVPKSWISVLNVISIGVEIAGNDGITTLNFLRLKEECWEISRDGGKTWQKCHKEGK